MFRRIWVRLAEKRTEKADQALRQLAADAECLRLGPVPESVASALRAYHEDVIWVRVIWISSIFISFKFVPAMLLALVEDITPIYSAIAAGAGDSKSVTDVVSRDLHSISVAVLGLLMARRLAVFCAQYFNVGGVGAESVQRWVDLINECANTVRASSDSWDVPQVSLRLSLLRVRSAKVMRGTVPIFSHRRFPLSAHAREVVTALKQAHREFDVDRDVAARKLARLLLKVSDQYSRGCVGALLPAHQLTDRPQGRDTVRPVMLIAVMTLAALSVHHIGVPVPVAVGFVILVGVVLYQSATSAAFVALIALVPHFFEG